MSSLNLSAKQIVENVSKKLKLQNVKVTREITGDYFLDGKYQFRVTMPNIHGNKGAISTGWLKVCRNSVFLSAGEYADLVRCPMSGDEYEDLIKEKIALRQISR